LLAAQLDPRGESHGHGIDATGGHGLGLAGPGAGFGHRYEIEATECFLSLLSAIHSLCGSDIEVSMF
jgi:hypothetical protein